MAQRKTTADTNIDGLVSEATEILRDASSMKAKTDFLALLPTPEYVAEIPISATRPDRQLNVRDDTSYGKEANADLYASMREYGYLKGKGATPVWSLRRDGFYYPLVGNLRHDMANVVNTDTLAETERRNTIHLQNNEPLEEYIQPIPFVHGLVYEGLTQDQEFALVADHLGSTALNEFEEAKEVGEFKLRSGRSFADVAKWFGLKPPTAQRLCYRYLMPPVLEMYRREKAKNAGLGPFVKISQKALTKLYSGYELDQQAGCKPRECGTNFQKVWDVILAAPNAFDLPPAGTKMVKRDVVMSQIGALEAGFGTGPEVKAAQDILRFTADAPGEDGSSVSLQAVIRALQDAMNILRRRADDAEKRFEEVMDERDSITLERNELFNTLQTVRVDNDKDREGFVARISELANEVLTLEGTIREKDQIINELNTAKNGKVKAGK